MEINSTLAMREKWLYDTVASKTCMSHGVEWKEDIAKSFISLSSPLILEYDGIDNLGITHLSRSNKFAFQEDLNPKDFQKADLKINSSISIPFKYCGMPVRLGTPIGKDQPMPNRLKAVLF